MISAAPEAVSLRRSLQTKTSTIFESGASESA
jgi:hypothetical protein